MFSKFCNRNRKWIKKDVDENLAKWLSVHLWTTWLWVQVPLQSLKKTLTVGFHLCLKPDLHYIKWCGWNRKYESSLEILKITNSIGWWKQWNSCIREKVPLTCQVQSSNPPIVTEIFDPFQIIRLVMS